MLTLLLMLQLAQVSSPVGDGVCVTFTASIDSAARELVGESVEAIGGYCSLSGCRLTGNLRFGNGADIIMPEAASGIWSQVLYLSTYPGTTVYVTADQGTGSLQFGVGAGTYAQLSGSTGRFSTLIAGITSATDLTSTTFTQATTYLRSVGVTASSLPTCSSSIEGAIEYNPDADGGTQMLCDHTVGYQWHYVATSNYASGPITMIAQTTQPRIEFYRPLNGSGGTQLPIAGGVNYGNGALLSPTNATISSGFGTTPSITANGANAFTITVGNPTGASGVVTLPTAATGWNCFCEDITTHSTTVFRTRMTASTTTSCTVGNFNNTPASANWVAADVLRCIALAY